MEKVKYQSRVREMTSDGETSTVIYYGSQAEMEALFRDHKINEAGEDGRLKNLRLYQASGDIWEIEFRYERYDGTSATAPDTSFGKKSAHLGVAMLSIPLENHPGYRAHWNHYLFAAPGTTTAPLWYLDRTDTLLSQEEYQSYRWGKSLADCPRDEAGPWMPVCEPGKPGRETYDVATYTVTESARFGSADQAGRMVANRANKIGTPAEDFGLTGGNWKCDDARVEWTGKYYLATLTWTRSGDAQGWDTDLYDPVP